MEGVVEKLLNPSVFLGLFVGVFVSILCYFFVASKPAKVVKKSSKKKTEVKTAKPQPQQVKQKQKQPSKKVSHPSHASSFKGQSGNVTDADLSSNGKYLATCCDDDPGSTSTEDSCGSFSSSSESNKENTVPISINEKRSKCGVKQRCYKRKSQRKKNNVNANVGSNIKKRKSVSPSGLTEENLYSLLADFTLLPEQLFTNGYPDLNEANQVRVLKQCFWSPPRKNSRSYSDSDQNSNSSDSCEDSELGNTSLGSLAGSKESAGVERTCVRCNLGFFITDTEYLTKERCNYHWGRIQQAHFSCCKKIPGSLGCTSSKLHVWNGTVAGINEPLQGFVSTKNSRKDKKRKVYALDCEMCYTVKGLELCKVTVLGFDGNIVYNHFVRPDNEVVDYNTRYSGVTENEVNGPNSKSFSEVQKDLLNIVTEDTILVGHGLDNDLRVLKLLHSKIVDTALIFPHERGFPFRYSLKYLTSTYLKKQIQTSDIGHDPYEDAFSCLELINFKIKLHHGNKYYNLIRRTTL